MPRKKSPAKAEPPLRLEWRSPSELAENPRNWRRHPEAQVAALGDVLGDVGWAGACLFNERTGRLIDGHARKKVAEAQGREKVPVLVGSWDEEAEAKILATLDPLGAMATADAAALEALLRDVQTESQAVEDMLRELAERAGVVAEQPMSAAPDEEEYWGDEDEDGLDLLFKAPFPWFGGKSRVAKLVWNRFGDIRSYVEPFFGSGAVFLNRPQPFEGLETVNDADGLICNFWRAVQADPDTVATYADWPINENDLTARHAWLVGQKVSLQERLEGDPDYYDAKVAGWWCWGVACWIGSGFCSGQGPWQAVDMEDGTRRLVRPGGAGQGVNRQLVHLGSAGRGVNRQRVHLGDAGRGVNRQLVHLGDAGQGESKAGLGECGLKAWMAALSERLRRVRVCCGDWSRVCGGNDGNALCHLLQQTPCGVFLDPPYSEIAGRTKDIYVKDSTDVAHAVREWAIRHGEDERLRIALCGYLGEHEMPASWTRVRWKAAGGLSMIGHGPMKLNRYRECVWFSPHCLPQTSLTS